MTEREPTEGLYLRGDLQMETAERVLRLHRADSNALKVIVNLTAFHENMPDHLKTEKSSMSLCVHAPEMKKIL